MYPFTRASFLCGVRVKKPKTFNSRFRKVTIRSCFRFPSRFSILLLREIEKERVRERGGRKRPSLISRYPHETSAQETNWISLPRHANDRIPFPWLEVVGAMHLLARSSGGRSRRSSENRITAAVERVPFPRVLGANVRKKEKERKRKKKGRKRKKGRKKNSRVFHTEESTRTNSRNSTLFP